MTVPIYIPHPDVPYYSVRPLPFLEFLFYILTEYALIVHNTTSRFEVYFILFIIRLWIQFLLVNVFVKLSSYYNRILVMGLIATVRRQSVIFPSHIHVVGFNLLSDNLLSLFTSLYIMSC